MEDKNEVIGQFGWERIGKIDIHDKGAIAPVYRFFRGLQDKYRTCPEYAGQDLGVVSSDSPNYQCN